MKKEKDKQIIRAPFKAAALALIVIMVCTFSLSGFSHQIGSVLSLIVSSIIIASSLIVFVGLFNLGKKYKNDFLQKTVIVGFILYISMMIFASYVPDSYIEKLGEINNTLMLRDSNLSELIESNASQEAIDLYDSETINYLLRELPGIIAPIVVFLLIFAIYMTFLGASFIKLRKVRRAKAIGILVIIGAWFALTLIGMIVTVVVFVIAQVLLVISFLEESKKFKE